jgi:vacuolar protein sorting-associated protein 26
MELSIIRRETTGSPPNQYNESETITKFEIMDGAPVRGETIPIRLFLGGFDLTPTFREVNKRFSVRYYLNLVLIDEENRRYFKQQVGAHLSVYFPVLTAFYRRLPSSVCLRCVSFHAQLNSG